MSFFAELKRRNVLRVAVAYGVAAWLVIQVVETVFPAFGFGDVAVRNNTIVFAIGFTPAHRQKAGPHDRGGAGGCAGLLCL